MPVVNSVVINSGEGITYAQILKDLKQNVKSNEVGVTTYNVRKTAKGDVLLAFNTSNTSGTGLSRIKEGSH